eukprot:CAMPEP_0202902562 /NCGR_PEP_ID=MMETSP1392-20130828/16921_1 /ASSEMBLY_ACC=CAM_ASM_000868 /TAXON_ID=225041 /ORGANISM="Chlamydomonas chlamydogama, Strain SAG 11-48b" /LENGTH=239 /DNA_ID=CAMNT_0049589343 /DNA_START=132 /DNA_END=853 /DNA_ORIENTATION=+
MAEAEAKGEKVQLYVYDLTQGMARALSPMLLGKQIEGVWHTGVVVGGVEHFFGCGLQRTPAGTTPFGQPLQVLDIGTTCLDEATRDALLADMSPQWLPEHYSLLTRNCNNFSNEFCELLCGTGIPKHILTQAEEVLNTPMGQMLMPMLLQMEGQLGNATATGFQGKQERELVLAQGQGQGQARDLTEHPPAPLPAADSSDLDLDLMFELGSYGSATVHRVGVLLLKVEGCNARLMSVFV